MPIPYQVTMYKCSHRCGKYSRNEKFIAGHEPHCWKNPARRTCKGCIYKNVYPDGAGDIFGDGSYVEPDWYVRECDHPTESDNAEKLILAIYDELGKKHPANRNLYGIHIPPVTDCPYWTPKEN